MATELETLWINKQSNPIQMNISDNQQPSGDKQSYIVEYRFCSQILDISTEFL